VRAVDAARGAGTGTKSAPAGISGGWPARGVRAEGLNRASASRSRARRRESNSASAASYGSRGVTARSAAATSPVGRAGYGSATRSTGQGRSTPVRRSQAASAPRTHSLHCIACDRRLRLARRLGSRFSSQSLDRGSPPSRSNPLPPSRASMLVSTPGRACPGGPGPHRADQRGEAMIGDAVRPRPGGRGRRPIPLPGGYERLVRCPYRQVR